MTLVGVTLALAGNAIADSIEPTWESLAAHYEVPEWFVDGKLGVWFHWGIPSSIQNGRPHDGSHYGHDYGQLYRSCYASWHGPHHQHYCEHDTRQHRSLRRRR